MHDKTDVNLLDWSSPLTIYLVSSLLLTVVTHFVAFSWVPGLSKMSANQTSPTRLLFLTVRQHSIKILQTWWKKCDICSDRIVNCKLFQEFSMKFSSDCTFNTILDKIHNLLTCLFCEDHSALLKDIKWSIEQNTVRLFVISSSTPTFLIEILHWFAQGVMNYEAHIWLINAHSESYCSYHNLWKQNKKKTLPS